MARLKLNPPGRGFMNPPGNKPINANVPRQRKQGPKPPNPRPNGGNKGPGKRQRQNRNPGREYLEPPTAQSINKETRASTQTKFGPLERAEGAEKRASERRTHEEGDWWQNYLNTVNQGQGDTSAAYATAAQQSQAQMGQASSIDTANTQRLQEEAAKSAELRGATPSAAPAEREAAAQGMRNYLATAQAGSQALSGAVQRGYLNEAKRIGVGQSIASRKEEQRRTRKIEQDRTATRKERGSYAEAKRGELRAGAREEQFKNKAFGLEKKESRQKANEAARTAKEKAEDRRYEREQDAIGNRQAQERIGVSKEGNKPGKNGLTPSEQRDAQEGRQGAIKAAWSLYRAAKKPPTTPQQWAAFESLLRAESEISPSEAAYAIKKLKARVGNAPVQGNRGLPGKPVPYAP